MIYVGVPNSPTKARLTNRKPSRTIHVEAHNLAWDCVRHREFLHQVLRHRDTGYQAWMLTTAYAAYLLKTGRTMWAVHQRCGRFANLLMRIKEQGWQGPWAVVTDDGLRLDGSHRAAVAAVLSLGSIPVSVVPYLPADADWREEMQTLRVAKMSERTKERV